MDTKLKNRHKLAIFFIMITILIPSLAMMTGYFSWYQMKTETKTKAFKNAEKSSDFLGHFLESTYLLYNTESGRKYADDVEKSLYDSYNAEMSRYSHFNSYLDYRVLDENGEMLGETGLIKPNEYVKYVALSRELPQGTKIKLKIMGYEPQTYRSAGAATLNTTIGGQSDQ